MAIHLQTVPGAVRGRSSDLLFYYINENQAILAKINGFPDQSFSIIPSTLCQSEKCKQEVASLRNKNKFKGITGQKWFFPLGHFCTVCSSINYQLHMATKKTDLTLPYKDHTLRHNSAHLLALGNGFLPLSHNIFAHVCFLANFTMTPFLL